MIDSLIILGGHIQALGLARQAKAKGIRVILLIPDKYSVARFSRSVDKVFVCDTEDRLIRCLASNRNKGTMLFPTSDDYIEFIFKHFDSLKDGFTIALPEMPIVELFANKTLTYKFAEANGIPHPRSRYPQDYEQLEAMSDGLEYPVVVKPSVMYSFHKKFGKKAFLCENKEAMLVKVKELVDADYPVNALIIQEFLSGGAKNLYSYGFLAIDGEVKSSIMANRIRQNPMDFGNSTTFAVSVDIQELEDISKRIIGLTRYTGMGEVEFMYDKGEYKFLEINTRAWKWHTISNGRGFSFIGDWIDWLNTGTIRGSENRLGRCAWVERLTDLAVATKAIIRKQLKFKDVFLSYRQHKTSAVWSIKDPLPALMYLLMSPILFIKRH